MRKAPGSSEIIKEIFDARINLDKEIAERKKRELWEKIPDVKTIDERLEKTGILILDEIAKGHEGINARIGKIQNENMALLDKREKLLLEKGFPADYSDIKYHCEKCMDTGYSGESMCECMRAEFARLALESSGLGALVKKQSFDNFDLSCYEGTARTRAERNFDICKNYADDFESGSSAENLLFMGGTGLGKTHLSTSIAKKIIEKGGYVVYVSAQNMISDFASLRFGLGNAEGDEKTEKYFDCDFLIIDDLGSEMQSSLSVAALYNVINTRLTNEKPMLISTNLNAGELKKTYADRLTSRLFGYFTTLLFEGKDIRMVMLERKLGR